MNKSEYVSLLQKVADAAANFWEAPDPNPHPADKHQRYVRELDEALQHLRDFEKNNP